MVDGFGNEFLAFKDDQKRVERSTELPADYLSLVESMGLAAYTYGDLEFIRMSINKNPDDESRLIYKKLLDKLYAVGLDNKLLDNLK